MVYFSVVVEGSAELQPCTTDSTLTPTEIDARFALYEQRAQEEDEEDEEEERIPDLQKDDMMARRTGVFQKQTTGTAAFNRFLPLPGSKWSRAEVAADAVPFNKKDQKSKEFITRVDGQPPSVPEETPHHQLKPAVIRPMLRPEGEPKGDEDGKHEHEPDLAKDDMMARKTTLVQKAGLLRGNQNYNQFLPIPGSVTCNIGPVTAVKQSCKRSKLAENTDRGSSVVAMTVDDEGPPCKASSCLRGSGLTERQTTENQEKGNTVMVPDHHVTDPFLLSTSSLNHLPSTHMICKVEEKLDAGIEEEKNRDGNMKLEKKPSWLEDELPPMMVSRRVAFLLENESVSMSDMVNEDEAGHLPSLSPSQYEHMDQQYNTFLEEEDHWQDDLARWKNRRRGASQELIKKEEERKRMEKRMKENGLDGSKRKSIKTYREIVEEKERREAELCEAYRKAATPEEAAMVLQRYALRFTISDATLDSLKLPRYPNKSNQHRNQTEQEHKQSSARDKSERPDHPNKTNSDVLRNQESSLATHEKDKCGVNLTSSSVQDSFLPKHANFINEIPQSEQIHEQPTVGTDPLAEHKKQPEPAVPQPQTEVASSPPLLPKHTPISTLSAPSRPLPLLVAKPYCPPKSPGHKPVHGQQMDELVPVNGEATDDVPSLQDSAQENKDVSFKQIQKQDPPEETGKSTKTDEKLETPQTENITSSTGSAISSLIAGRNCIITTTIVTELTKTHIEPLHPDVQNNEQNGITEYFETQAEEGNTRLALSPSSIQEYSPTVSEGLEESSVTIETPMLNLAKRVNHWVWDPNEERKRLEMWQQEQERLLQEQYQKEQEKLKKEWEKAQLEVEEEERKHNEEERRILEETVAPLSPSAVVQRPSEHTTATCFPEEENNNNTAGGYVSLQQNGQQIHKGNEDQHASKLHFLQDSGVDEQPPKKQEMWKTASLDRSPQMTQTFKRSGSHDAVTSEQDLTPSTPKPPSPSRCVSGKRLCSGCSKPLGRGAAMIIDTLGLFFHMQCFKCGVCKRQLGDATAGTDVRMRNGLLSCYECYIASRGRGQPTPL